MNIVSCLMLSLDLTFDVVINNVFIIYICFHVPILLSLINSFLMIFVKDNYVFQRQFYRLFHVRFL